jgi:hypothetical protein
MFVLSAGVINPALLSIQKSDGDEHLFWIVWCLQLAVSLITAFQSFFKWDKKYYLFHNYRTKVTQEMWLYLELTGHYGESDNEEQVTHKTKLNDFLLRLEVIYRKLKDSSLEIESQTDDTRKTKSNHSTQDKDSVDENQRIISFLPRKTYNDKDIPNKIYQCNQDSQLKQCLITCINDFKSLELQEISLREHHEKEPKDTSVKNYQKKLDSFKKIDEGLKKNIDSINIRFEKSIEEFIIYIKNNYIEVNSFSSILDEIPRLIDNQLFSLNAPQKLSHIIQHRLSLELDNIV